jgi:hypothetical protein
LNPAELKHVPFTRFTHKRRDASADRSESRSTTTEKSTTPTLASSERSQRRGTTGEREVEARTRRSANKSASRVSYSPSGKQKINMRILCSQKSFHSNVFFQ